MGEGFHVGYLGGVVLALLGDLIGGRELVLVMEVFVMYCM